MQPAIAELVGEIRNSVQYFATLPGRAPIARVLLTGGGARLRGLVKELRAQVRIPVEHVSPLARLDLSQIDLDPEQAASIEPVLATPIGLALPEPNPSVKKFNLVPPEVTQRAFEREVARKAFVAAAVVVLLLVGCERLSFPPGPQRPERRQQPPQPPSPTSTRRSPSTTRSSPSTTSSGWPRPRSRTSASTAVDWSAVVSQLGSRIPAGLSVNTFTGTGGSPGPEPPPVRRDGKPDFHGHDAGPRGDRLAVGGTVRQLPELCSLRSRGPVDRQPHRVADVQPAGCERRGQHAGRGGHHRDVHFDAVALAHVQPDQERRLLMDTDHSLPNPDPDRRRCPRPRHHRLRGLDLARREQALEPSTPSRRSSSPSRRISRPSSRRSRRPRPTWLELPGALEGPGRDPRDPERGQLLQPGHRARGRERRPQHPEHQRHPGHGRRAAGANPVAVTFTLTGTYGQMSSLPEGPGHVPPAVHRHQHHDQRRARRHRGRDHQPGHGRLHARSHRQHLLQLRAAERLRRHHHSGRALSTRRPRGRCVAHWGISLRFPKGALSPCR